MRDFERVWYACYGSNLMEDRFLCYIAGGTPKGAKRTYIGCSDKTLPKTNHSFLIHHELYFAKSANTWSGGAAAFIKPIPNEDTQTFGKIYSISKNQFIELVKQEIDTEKELDINFDEAIKNGHLDLKSNAWYNRILFLGYHEELPVFSFTNAKFLKDEINTPHPDYLEKIITGLRETYQFTPVEIINYLKDKEGILGKAITKDLDALVNNMISN
ncbi:hypothetical protein [Zunongwangia pacifica]|uniref:Histone deacetylase n=1 Tax=Zunongwangia pacifica TaxID=2911062 RepID=A0A9X2CQ72_9FLAO|nr:hypothetical protein [Zunongwangia pacifica]MCL6219228.1 hypothetical protein [Zunongwangia pacifica]